MTDDAKSEATNAHSGEDEDSASQNAAERLMLQRGFIVILALLISAVFLWMIRDFLSVLFLAGVLALLLMPVQSSFTKLFGGRARPAAVVVMILAGLVLILPVSAILFVIARQAVEVSQIALPWIQEQIEALREGGFGGGLPAWMPFRETLAPYQAELTNQLGEFASRAGTMIVNGLTRATGNTLGFFLDTIVLIFALFLFLISGRSMAANTVNLLPMPSADRNLLARRTLSTIRATVKGTFVIAAVQGTLIGIGLAMTGIPGAAFWGAVTGVLSIIPLVGPPLVWIPAALFLYMEGEVAAAIGLAAYGLLFVGVLDNILRPMLVGQDTKMPDLLILISTVGGLTLFGAVGIIIGPVIAALFISVWYIYAQSYAPLLQERTEAVSLPPDEDDEAVGGRPETPR